VSTARQSTLQGTLVYREHPRVCFLVVYLATFLNDFEYAVRNERMIAE
jgi:hypothetical protein